MGDSAQTETKQRHEPQAPQPAGPQLQAEQPQLGMDSLVARTSLDIGRLSPSDVVRLQRMVGNRTVSRMLATGRQEAGPIQAKLAVGPAGDRYEQEADRVAERVVSKQPPAVQRQEEEEEVQTMPPAASITPLPSTCPEGVRAGVRRAPEEEEEVQTKHLQRAAAGGSFDAGPEIARRLAARQGAGAPLPHDTRAVMEQHLGADFDQVRVHTDPEAGQISRQLGAQAFTHGQDIYVGAGAPRPASTDGQRLLAHELTHVVQQSGPAVQRAGRAGVRPSRSPAGTVQRMIFGAGDIIAALKYLPTIQDLLEGRTSLIDQYREFDQATTKGDDPTVKAGEQEQRLAGDPSKGVMAQLRQGGTLEQHIIRVLNRYETWFQTGADDKRANAMKIAAAVSAIARIVAAKYHIPHERDRIAGELMTYFQDKILAYMVTAAKPDAERTAMSEAFGLAGAITRKDPVGMFMQEKMTVSTAAGLVNDMAEAASLDPSVMLTLLSQQYQSRMGAYDKTDVGKGQRPVVTFGQGFFKEIPQLYGEVSQTTYERAVRLTGAGTPDWGTGRGSILTDEKQIKLTELGAEVTRVGDARRAAATTAGVTGGSSGGGGPLPPGSATAARLTAQAAAAATAALSGDPASVAKAKDLATASADWGRLRVKQKAFLEGLAGQEGALVATADAAVRKFFTDRGKDPAVEIEKCKRNLERAVWVLAFKPEEMYKDAGTIPTTYGTMYDVADQDVVDLSTLLPGSTTAIPRISRIKPDFRSRGPDYAAQRMEKDLRAAGNADFEPSDLGRYGSVQDIGDPPDWNKLKILSNYGGYHFILRKDALRDRTRLCLNTQLEREDPILLLDDLGKNQGTNTDGMLTKLAEGRMQDTLLECHTYGEIRLNSDHIQAVLLEKGTRAAKRGGDRPELTPAEMGEIVETMKGDLGVQGELTAAETRARRQNADRFFLFRASGRSLEVMVSEAKRRRLDELQAEHFRQRKQSKADAAARVIDATTTVGIPPIEYG